MSRKIISYFLVITFAVIAAGCAGTVPNAELKNPLADSSRLCANDDATAKVIASAGVDMDDTTRGRLETQIIQAVNEKIKTASCQSPNKRSFVLNAKITRYEKGNAFARFMLAGLGQIHVDGDVSLAPIDHESAPIAEFTLRKTFAWGGIYGAMTGIEDIEKTFAEGVAETIVSASAVPDLPK